MAKRPRLSVVEKIAAKKAAPTANINPADIANVIFGAKHGLMVLGDQDRVNVSVSIANLSDALRKLEPQAAPPAAAPAEAPAAAQAAAKG